MSDLPGSSEASGLGATPEIKGTLPSTPETPAPVEIPTQKIEQKEEVPVEVALPSVLQPDQRQTPAVVAAKPIGDEHLNQGPKVSKLTAVAVRTFQELQRKLAAHYEKLRREGTA